MSPKAGTTSAGAASPSARARAKTFMSPPGELRIILQDTVLCGRFKSILELPDLFDLDHDFIPVLDPDRRRAGKAHALGRSGEDDRAWAEGHRAAEAFDQGGYVEDHVGGGVVLHDLAVGGGDFVGSDDPRTDGAEAVEAFATGELPAAQRFFPLPVAG